jgi:hypothetical protein
MISSLYNILDGQARSFFSRCSVTLQLFPVHSYILSDFHNYCISGVLRSFPILYHGAGSFGPSAASAFYFHHQLFLFLSEDTWSRCLPAACTLWYIVRYPMRDMFVVSSICPLMEHL